MARLTDSPGEPDAGSANLRAVRIRRGRGRRVITLDAGFEFRFAERCKGAGLRPEDVVEYRDALLK